MIDPSVLSLFEVCLEMSALSTTHQLVLGLRELPHLVSLSFSFFGVLTMCCLLEMLRTRFSDPVIIIPRVLLEEDHSHLWREASLGGAAGSYALP